MATKIAGITVEIGGDTTKLGMALNDAESKSKDLQKELGGVNTLLKKIDPKNTELLAQKQQILTREVEATKDKLQTLRDTQEQVQAQFDKGEITEEQYRDFQREIINTEDQLKSLEKELSNFGSVGAQKVAAVGEQMKDVGGKIEDVGKKVSVFSGAAAGILSGSIVAASDFEDAMAKVNTIADTSDTSLDKLKGQITDLSNQTGISASEIADATYNAISAGQKTGDAVNFVSAATSLAKAGFTDTGASIDVLTTILNAYGMEAGEVNKVSDILIQTQNKGKTTVAELSASMGKVIPTANSMNVGLDQLGAAYSIMTAKGIATAQSTTYMNSMLNELGKGGTTVSDLLKEKTGKSFQDLMADGNSLGDVLKILQDHCKKSGTNFNDLWGSAEAGKAALTLTSGGVDEFNDAVDGMNDSTGATAAALEKLETPSQKAKVALNQGKNAVIDLGSTVITSLMPVFEKIVAIVKTVTERFSNLSDGTKRTIVVILGIVAALGPVLIIIGKVVGAIGTILTLAPKITAAIKAVKGVVAGFGSFLAANQIVLIIAAIVAAIVALIAILVVLYKKCTPFREFVDELWAKIKEFFGNLPAWFTEHIVTPAKELWEKIKAVPGDIAAWFEEKIAAPTREFWEKIKAIPGDVATWFTQHIVAPVQEHFEKMKEIFDELVGWINERFVQPISDFIASIVSAFRNAGGGVKGIISGVLAAIKWILDGWFNIIDKLTGGKLSAILNKFKSVFGKIKETVSNVFQSIKNLISNWKFTMPHIKLPKFTITPNGWKIGDLLKGVRPHLSIAWHAKAMDDGMILNNPTIFGIGNRGQLLGGGEAGSETVVGTQSLLGMIERTVANCIKDIIIEMYLDGDVLVGGTANRMDTALGKISIRKGRGT